MKYRKRSRWRIIVVLVALYAALGFFALPPLVKWQLEKRLTETLARPVSVGQVRTNPFALSIAVNRVVVRVPDGSDTLVQWNRFFVNFDPLASITREWVLGDVAVDGLSAAIEVRPDGSLNISDLIEKFRPPESRDETPRPAEKPSRPWRIQRLNITDARVEFADASQAEPFHTTLGPVNLTVLDFRTAGLRSAPGRFEAVSDSGEKMTWIGSFTAAPLTSTGELRVENVLLPKYAPYLAERLRATITSGRLGLSVNYDIDLSPGNRRFAITDGTTQLSEFHLKENDGGEPLVELGSFQVAGIVADGFAPRVAIEAIRLDGGTLTVRRDAEGVLNWLGLLPTDDGAAASSTQPPKQPLDLNVKEISLRDFAITARDLSMPQPVEASLTRINGSLKNATLAAGAAMPIDLSFDWAPRGAVRVNGAVMREPLMADLDFEIAWLALPPLSPYLEERLNARMARGAASMNGHARVELKEAAPPDVTFSGGGRVEDFSLVASEGGQELASLSELAFNDVKLTTSPRTVLSIAEVSVGSPQAHVTVNEEGELNFAQLVRAPVEGQEQSADAAGEGT
ncbi:MAG TPA: DUF748 domain-containing protein, partial [Opitutus sp.]|nr:DUF748 domain-containing protein [Opitutus sp.]